MFTQTPRPEAVEKKVYLELQVMSPWIKTADVEYLLVTGCMRALYTGSASLRVATLQAGSAALLPPLRGRLFLCREGREGVCLGSPASGKRRKVVGFAQSPFCFTLTVPVLL